MYCRSPVFVIGFCKQFQQLSKTDLFEQFPSDHPHTPPLVPLCQWIHPPVLWFHQYSQLHKMCLAFHCFMDPDGKYVTHLAHRLALLACHSHSQLSEPLSLVCSLQESFPYHSYNSPQQILHSRCYHIVHTYILHIIIYSHYHVIILLLHLLVHIPAVYKQLQLHCHPTMSGIHSICKLSPIHL